MTNPVKKRVVTLDDLNILNQNAAYARQKGEAAETAATRATMAAEQAELAAGHLPAAAEAAGYVRDAREAAGYLAPLAAAKDQADQNHARANQDHQQVGVNLAGIAQAQAQNNAEQAQNNLDADELQARFTGLQWRSYADQEFYVDGNRVLLALVDGADNILSYWDAAGIMHTPQGIDAPGGTENPVTLAQIATLLDTGTINRVTAQTGTLGGLRFEAVTTPRYVDGIEVVWVLADIAGTPLLYGGTDGAVYGFGAGSSGGGVDPAAVRAIIAETVQVGTGLTRTVSGGVMTLGLTAGLRATSTPDLWLLGDSLTYNPAYSTRVAAAVGGGRDIRNAGLPGNDSTSIAARAGAWRLWTTTAIDLPADGSEVPYTPSTHLLSGAGTFSQAFTVMGIPVTLRHDGGATPTTGNYIRRTTPVPSVPGAELFADTFDAPLSGYTSAFGDGAIRLTTSGGRASNTVDREDHVRREDLMRSNLRAEIVAPALGWYLAVRSSGTSMYYIISDSNSAQMGGVVLAKIVNGAYTQLGIVANPVPGAAAATWSLEATGTRLIGRCNGAVLFDLRDASLVSGSPGFGVAKSSLGSSVDAFRVYEVDAGTVAIPAGTHLYPAEPELAERTTIIWAGRNNVPEPSRAVRDIRAIVNRLRERVVSPRYLVLAVPPGTQASGTTGSMTDPTSAIYRLNDALQQQHGDRFIPLPAALLDGNGYLNPAYAQSDGVHLTDGAYDLITAQIGAEFTWRLW